MLTDARWWRVARRRASICETDKTKFQDLTRLQKRTLPRRFDGLGVPRSGIILKWMVCACCWRYRTVRLGPVHPLGTHEA